jgi:hypothetical protein
MLQKIVQNSFILTILFILTVYPDVKAQTQQNTATGMYWPEGQAFPYFAAPAETLDGFNVEDPSLGPEEKVMMTVFQGLINKTKPSIHLFRPGGEGMYRWPTELGLKIKEHPVSEKWELIWKYKDQIDGVVLYSVEKNVHYRNLATTVAGLKNVLPVTDSIYQQMLLNNLKLPVVTDLSKLPYATPEDIYRHLYDEYWKDCTKRLLISHSALVFIRDIAVASKAAVVWLDPRKEKENEVVRLFLKDMKAGESIILGWWAEERSGIGIGTEYGLSTIPADFYENATVYAGMDHVIRLPVTPKKPNLENKIYLSIYLSDGDNIQYCQHSMPKLWDDKGRGTVPVNWTVSPGLADLGPQLLNYYYKTATPNDFLASGPSGLGYALIYDAPRLKWNNEGGEAFDRYTQFTQTYLEKSGLRVITIWDQINEAQMDSYTNYCRYLYGATQQDWRMRGASKVLPYTKQNKLAFLPNFPAYTNTTDAFVRNNRDTIANFDGSYPIFLTAQGVSWRMGPDSLVLLKEKLEQLSPGNIVLCRGDHFFTLYNEANGMEFNLTLSADMQITSSPTATQAAYAADGSCRVESSWVSSSKGKKWIQFDFRKEYNIARYVIRHAGVNGVDPSFNTKDFMVSVSSDGKKWVVVDKQTGNAYNVTDKDIAPVNARYVRIDITKAGKDEIARIADIEIYGTIVN